MATHVSTSGRQRDDAVHLKVAYYIGSKMLNFRRGLCLFVLLAATLAATTTAFAAEYHGLVTFGGLPVPGATVTVTQGGKKYVTVTDTQGFYSFPTLADGPATVEVEMTGFAPFKDEVTIAPDAAPSAGIAKLELKLLTLDQIRSDL